MKSGKMILAGLASVMLISAASIPALAQQADGNKPPMPPHGPAGFMFQLLDTDHNGSITREEFDADKAKIFGEIDKNGDKKLSYDEVKAWAKDVMAKMPEHGPGPADDAAAPPPPADGKAPAAGDKAPDKAADANGPADDQAPPPPPPGGPDGMHGPMDGPDGMRGPHGHHMGPHGGPRDMMGKFSPRERLAQLFLRADANDDGFVSQDEFNVFADQMFTRMDRNDDGALNQKDMPRHPPMGPHGGWKKHHGDHRPGDDSK